MIRRLWWYLVAWRKGVPVCPECGRPRTDGGSRWECVPCDRAWTARMRRRREGKG